jgi:hypothetical protein
LVGEVSELMEKPEVINIYNTHSSLIGDIFNYVEGHFWPRMGDNLSLYSVLIFLSFFIWMKEFLFGIDSLLSFIFVPREAYG